MRAVEAGVAAGAAAPVFGALLRELEGWIVAELALRARGLPAELADAEGSWKGERVLLRTRTYAGDRIRLARFATVSGGGLDIGNLLVLARDDLALPILGADLVALGARGGGAMLAADLSPVLPPGPGRDAQLAPLAAAVAPYADLPPGGELPGWCARWFSPHALYTRPGPAELSRAIHALREYPRAFAALVHAATPRPERAADARTAWHGYAAAHREDDKGLGMLAKIVSPAWADRYLGEALFPDSAW